jgi:hypothetical protein
MAAGFGDMVAGGVGAFLVLFGGVMLLRLGTAAFDRVAPQDAEAVPVLRLAAFGTGVALGLGLLAAAPEPGIFLPGRIFAAEGPWALGLGEALARHALPGGAAVRALGLAAVDAGGVATVAAWLVAAGTALGAGTALRLWYGPARLRALGAFLLLVLHVALMLHVGLHLAAWVAARLGFWLFALALVLFQRHRYARHPAH